jgi:hypothetical protein
VGRRWIYWERSSRDPVDESDGSDDALDGLSTRFQKFTHALPATHAEPGISPAVALRVVSECAVTRAE